MNNKKGFTLVELLAVIAVLAILTVIAIPNVMKLFNDAKKKTFETEVRQLYKVAKQSWLSDSMFSTSEKVYSRCSECTGDELKLSGRSNLDYYIKMDRQGNIKEFSATDGTYQFTYEGDLLDTYINNVQTVSELEKEDIIIIKKTGPYRDIHIATFVTRQVSNEITPGDELRISGEPFYVVTSDSNETVLLAKYDLNKTTYMQDTSGKSTNVLTTKFSDTGYWDGCNAKIGGVCNSSPEGLISPYSNDNKSYCARANGVDCAYVYDSNSLLYPIINNYANSISSSTRVNVTGRILSIEEAWTLKNKNTAGAKAIKDKNGYGNWIGSTVSKHILFSASSSGDIYNNLYFWTSYPIRPVIVVNTDVL